jgi:hypothetical protein
MPIRPDLRHHYRTPEWRAARSRIMARAKNCCEQCGKPNRAAVETLTGRSIVTGDPTMLWRHAMLWRPVGDGWRNDFGGPEPFGFEWLRASGRGVRRARTIRVVLTVAHLNHVAGDDRNENLKVLCQWCHLHYDAGQHKQTRATRKDAARPMQWKAGIEL